MQLDKELICDTDNTLGGPQEVGTTVSSWHRFLDITAKSQLKDHCEHFYNRLELGF